MSGEVHPTVDSGETRWSGSSATLSRDMGEAPYQDTFTACITLPAPTSGKLFVDYFAVVTAQLDSRWTQQKHPEPAVKPQAHMSQQRTSDNFHVRNGNSTINGHVKWYSWPVRIRVKSFGNSIASSTPVTTPASSSTNNIGATTKPSLCLAEPAPQIGVYATIVIVAAVLPVTAAAGLLYVRYRRRRAGLAVEIASNAAGQMEPMQMT